MQCLKRLQSCLTLCGRRWFPHTMTSSMACTRVGLSNLVTQPGIAPALSRTPTHGQMYIAQHLAWKSCVPVGNLFTLGFQDLQQTPDL